MFYIFTAFTDEKGDEHLRQKFNDKKDDTYLSKIFWKSIYIIIEKLNMHYI